MDTTLVLAIVVVTAVSSAAGAVVFSRRNPQLLAPNVADPAEALRSATAEVLRGVQTAIATERDRAAETLDHKKELIDGTLTELRTQLEAVKTSIATSDLARQKGFGELNQQLQLQSEGVAALTTTTAQLREALANVKVRGQWGERMASDVLALAGLIEGVNYSKQNSLTNADGGKGIPDFTFFMPNSNFLYMDVKFPIDNYLRYLDTEIEVEKAGFRDAFKKDVRNRVTELVGRGYLDREDSVNCLLLFIPNESVYAFVNEHDSGLIDFAMKSRIIICSPLTLYAVLAVVRQAVANFTLERKSKEILELIGTFELQWSKYSEKLDKVQRSFDTVHKDYSDLMTTRARAVQRPLDKIAAIRGGDSLASADVEVVDDLVEIEG